MIDYKLLSPGFGTYSVFILLLFIFKCNILRYELSCKMSNPEFQYEFSHIAVYTSTNAFTINNKKYKLFTRRMFYIRYVSISSIIR